MTAMVGQKAQTNWGAEHDVQSHKQSPHSNLIYNNRGSVPPPKGADVVFGRASSFICAVGSDVLCLDTVNVVAVTTLRFLHVGMSWHHVPRTASLSSKGVWSMTRPPNSERDVIRVTHSPECSLSSTPSGVT